MHYTLTLMNDEDAEAPDNEYGWKLISFAPMHTAYENPDEYIEGVDFDRNPIPSPQLKEQLKKGLGYFLSYYEHGSCVWALMDTGPQCQWDTARIAGVLIWDEPESDMGPKTLEERRADAASFLQTYTSWANGSVYGFGLVSEDEDTEYDSCFGYYDTKDMLSEICQHFREGDSVFVTGNASWLVDGESLAPAIQVKARAKQNSSVVYAVRGKGKFPIDMLRYDRSSPYTEEDSYQIGLTEERTISLIRNACSSDWEPGRARWNTFDWQVEKD